MMFYVVHIFAVIWFYVLYSTDGTQTYDCVFDWAKSLWVCDSRPEGMFKYYILALRDAVLLFSASPPTHMMDR